MLPIDTVLGGTLSSTPQGVRLEVRLPWYRALPLSTVEFEHLAIDGRDVPLDGGRLEIGGQEFALADLAELTDTFWYVLDSGYLTLPDLSPPPGSRCTVSLSTVLYPPYIPGLRRVNTQTETVPVN